MTTSRKASDTDGDVRPSPVRLRPADAAAARAANAVGGGKRARFDLDGEAMLVRIAGVNLQSDVREEAAVCFETPHGFINLRHGAALMRLLTGIDLEGCGRDGVDHAGEVNEVEDASDPGEPELRRWEIEAAAERLPDGWRALFDVIALHEGWRAPEEARVAVWTRGVDGDWAVGGWLCGEAAVLEKILALPHWQDELAPPAGLLERLRVRRKVRLGTTRISVGEFGAIGKGDLLFIDSPCFDRTGAGTAWFGTVGMSGYLVSDQPAVRFQFEKWSRQMDDSFDDYEDEATGNETELEEEGGEEAEEEAGHATLDELTMRLVFEVGTLSLPLGELKRLAPGSVLDLERATPPAVTVRCGGRELARGELVEVDGRLAVEIIDMWIHHERDV